MLRPRRAHHKSRGPRQNRSDVIAALTLLSYQLCSGMLVLPGPGEHSKTDAVSLVEQGRYAARQISRTPAARSWQCRSNAQNRQAVSCSSSATGPGRSLTQAASALLNTLKEIFRLALFP